MNENVRGKKGPHKLLVYLEISSLQMDYSYSHLDGTF